MTIDYTPNSDSRRVLRLMEDAADFGEVHQSINKNLDRIRRVLDAEYPLRNGTSTPEWWKTREEVAY